MRIVKLNVLTIVFIIVASCQISSASKTNITTATIEKPKTGINFIEEDWQQALKTAKDKNKLIFLDIYATWCGPCKMLKQYTFTDSAVGEFFNKHFVNVSVDGEKGAGPRLAQQYAIQGYPTLIVADTTGKPVLITAGYIPTDVLMQFAKEALKRSGK